MLEQALLGRLSDPAALVGYRASRPVMTDEFLAEAGACARHLATLPSAPVALWLDDTLSAAACMLAILSARRCVILPGEWSPATQARLQAEGAVLMDTPFTSSTPGEPQRFPLRLEGGAELVLYTSGSTGEPLAQRKTLRQLLAEVAALEACFGERLPSHCCMAGSVPHQHLYGLLFRLLWPLFTGRPLMAEPMRHAETLWLAPQQAWCLVSSPAFLRRLPPALDWAGLPAPSLVFSSGGPLPADAALQANACLSAPVVEIYGSTETGGIAWRQDPSAAWQNLPGVEAWTDADSCLHVRSPWIGTPEGIQSADRVRLSANGFELLGRVDRIAKLEDKRISLTQVEQALKGLPQVSEARVVVLHDTRAQVAAVLVLSAAGRAELAELGKGPFDRMLRAALAGSIELLGVPRRWRYLDNLPQDALGKTGEAALRACFGRTRLLPEVLSEHGDDARVELCLAIEDDLAVFDGHFPGLPILPGVAQLDWAVQFARSRFSERGVSLPPACLRMEAVKFQHIIQNGVDVTLTLEWQAAKSMLKFEYRSAAGRHASGRFVLGDA